jgi:hypothetical protein
LVSLDDDWLQVSLSIIARYHDVLDILDRLRHHLLYLRLQHNLLALLLHKLLKHLLVGLHNLDILLSLRVKNYLRFLMLYLV